MKRQWTHSPGDAGVADEIQRECGVSRVVAEILAARGVQSGREASRFLEPDADELPDPALLPGADALLERVERCLVSGEPVAVYGHDDADGVTATVIMYEALSQLEARVMYYIPDRETEGHGMNRRALDRLAAWGVGLVVTVDCATSDREAVRYGLDIGIDTIVTDHHEIPQALPPAVAIVNPKLPDSAYPYRYLAGAGVSMRVADLLLHGLGSKFGKGRGAHWLGPGWRDEAISLAAIGSIADKVPLTGDNRTIVAVGLQKIPRTERPGLRALLEMSGLWGGELSVSRVQESVGPFFGGASDGSGHNVAVEVLLAGDLPAALDLARERRAAGLRWRREAQAAAARILEKLGGGDDVSAAPAVVIEESVPIHVVGYVTSRLSFEYGLPVILAVKRDGQVTAEARGPKGFNLVSAFDSMAHLFSGYGGHPRAAGFSMPAERMSEFRKGMLSYASANPPEAEKRRIDAELHLSQVTPEVASELGFLGPFGYGAPPPALVSRSTTRSDVAEARARGHRFTVPVRLDREPQDLVYRVRESSGTAVISVVDSL